MDIGLYTLVLHGVEFYTCNTNKRVVYRDHL